MSSNLISKKKALYICPAWGLWGSVINELEERFLISPALVISHNSNLMNKSINNKKCFLIDEKEFRYGKNSEEIKYALDQKLLNAISPYKNITIKMMERYYFGKFTNSSTNQEAIYHKLVKFAYSVFKKSNPDIVISASPPHRVYDYLIEQFCIVHNKKFVCFEHTNVPFLSYFRASGEDNFPYSRSKNEFMPISNELNDFIEKTKSSNYEDVKPVFQGQKSYFKDKKYKKDFKNNIFDLIALLSNLKIRVLLKPIVGRFIVKYESNSIKIKYSIMFGMLLQKIKKILSLNAVCIPYYNFISQKNCHDKFNYIYFSPNYQPERSTVPDGRVYWDFSLAIDLIHNSLPNGWKILYKEHPRVFRKNTDWDIDRDIFFYLRLKLKYPHLIFVDKNEDVLTLIDSSKAVAAVNGTSLWESVIRGRPTILFGDQWLKNMPGITCINNPSQCNDFLNLISQDGFKKNDRESLYEFFSLLESNSYDLSSYLNYAREVRAIGEFNYHSKDNIEFNEEEIVTKLVSAIISAC